MTTRSVMVYHRAARPRRARVAPPLTRHCRPHPACPPPSAATSPPRLEQQACAVYGSSATFSSCYSPPATRLQPCVGQGTSKALWAAVEAGDAGAVEAALAAGADVNNAPRGKEGRTPLWIAAQKGHEAVVERLLAAGAPVDQANRGGETLLCLGPRRRATRRWWGGCSRRARRWAGRTSTAARRCASPHAGGMRRWWGGCLQRALPPHGGRRAAPHRARLRAAAHAPLPPCCVTMTAKAAVLGHGLAPVRGRCKHCGNAQIPWYMVLTTPLLPPPTCTNPAGINCNLQPAAIGREMTKIAFWHPEKMRVRHDSKCIFLI